MHELKLVWLFIYLPGCLVVRLFFVLFIMHSSSHSVHTRLRSMILAILSCVRVGRSCAGSELILSFVGGSLMVNLFGELRLTYHCLASVELSLQVSTTFVNRRDGCPQTIFLSDQARVWPLMACADRPSAIGRLVTVHKSFQAHYKLQLWLRCLSDCALDGLRSTIAYLADNVGGRLDLTHQTHTSSSVGHHSSVRTPC